MVYGIDLTAEWGTLGVRRLWALVNGLPQDAPLWRDERIEAESWTRQDELLAQQNEILGGWLSAIFAQLRGEKRIKVPGEISYERPDHIQKAQAEAAAQAKQSKRVTSLENMREIAQFFGRTGKAM